MQHGFYSCSLLIMVCLSTVTAIKALILTIKLALEIGESALLTLIDLGKWIPHTFHILSHATLLQNLVVYGLDGIVLCMFQSYLYDRKLVVAIHGATSNFTSAWTSNMPYHQCLPLSLKIAKGLFLTLFNDHQDFDLRQTLTEPLLVTDDTFLLTSGSDLAPFLTKAAQLFGDAKSWFVFNNIRWMKT